MITKLGLAGDAPLLRPRRLRRPNQMAHAGHPLEAEHPLHRLVYWVVEICCRGAVVVVKVA